MRKAKTNSLIILALIINSIAMSLYAYRNFNNQDIGYGIVFTTLAIFLIGLVIYSIIRDAKLYNQNTN